MNPQLLRARLLVLGSFTVCFACQVYGCFAKPTLREMSSKAKKPLPHPTFLIPFFVFQTLVQLYWIRKLFIASSSTPRREYDLTANLPSFMGGIDQPSWNVDRLLDTLEQERARNPNEPDSAQMAYVPFYTLGNIGMIGWVLALLQTRFRLAVPFISLALLIQLYAVVIMDSNTKFRLSRHNWTTHVVSKSLMAVIWGSYMQTDDLSDEYQTLGTVWFWPMAFNLHVIVLPDPIFNFMLAYNNLGIAAGRPEGSDKARLEKYAARLAVWACIVTFATVYSHWQKRRDKVDEECWRLKRQRQ
ncbi:hypothetical protein PILCRDRAFT_3061 [Piloderma croceum F 1598]|uniref:Uncharacterized protein n=1 Tax=Piloderma croceum (strain F 1598) TaxID=765440 RepID=A0A0C3CGK7_PILCF|nr:hypothetical protein PILCRDRAFT_3061 [Piloderma croceum F 1598]